jgi:hypothetical protein
MNVDMDTALDVVGTAAAAYVGFVLTGGPELPVFAQMVPFIAATAVGIFTWRQVRKNNKDPIVKK